MLRPRDLALDRRRITLRWHVKSACQSSQPAVHLCLGEMDAKELWETSMNPAVRVLRQMTLNDAVAADDLFSLLMGEDVEARRNFITQNATGVRFLDV